MLVAIVVAGCTSDDGAGDTGPDPTAGTPDSATSTIDSAAAAADSTTETAEATIEERPDWAAVFDAAGVEGTFALREVGSGRTEVLDLTRATTQRRPASTFKILNSLVILETGTLPDVDTAVPWDGTEREVASWNQDHTLRSGIEVSAVWMFQEMARRIGEPTMNDWVAAADYGNADIGGGIDRFWLDGDLRISPVEQLDVLERLLTDDLPFDPDVQAQVRDIIVRESGDGWSWSHKTGTALVEDPALGWLVGATEHDGRRWVFAMNVDLGTIEGVGGLIDTPVRQDVTRQILVSEGALPV